MLTRYLSPPLLSAVVLLGVSCQKKSSGDKPETPQGEVAPVPLAPTDNPQVTPVTQPSEPSPTGPTTPEGGGQVDIGSPAPEPVMPVPGPEVPATPPPGEVPVTPPVAPVPTPTELRIKEAQFWVFERKDDQLQFNTPWDETEGDAILRDENAAPEYAKKCLNEAKDFFQNLNASRDFTTRMQELFQLSATGDLIFLVNVTDGDSDRNKLRQLDRDAYFWHWTDTAKKPVISLNSYSKGAWVWEVIAGPKTCIQPSTKEIGRYLAWTKKRLEEKGANP